MRAAPCGVVRCVPVSVRVRVPRFAAPRRGSHNLYGNPFFKRILAGHVMFVHGGGFDGCVGH